MKKYCLLVLPVFFVVSAFGDDAVREYTCNKVTGAAPTIDGNYTEAEWAGSDWTGEFYGLRNGAVTAFNGQKTTLNYRWRALWDDDYLYLLVTADFLFLCPNGLTWAGDFVDPLLADDTGYAGWGTGTCVDLELFIEPNWKLGDGYNSNPPAYDEATNGGGEPSYQICYFPLKDDKEGTTLITPGNFGVRTTDDGPPYFFSGVPAAVGGDWTPIFDKTFAATSKVKPMQFAAQPHEVAGGVEGKTTVASPVMEIGLPYSQLNISTLMGIGDVAEVAAEAINMILTPDSNGKYVKAGDEWLINVTGYTDGAVAETGLTLVTWNNVVGGGFRTYPRGILRFAVSTATSDWMMY